MNILFVWMMGLLSTTLAPELLIGWMKKEDELCNNIEN